jgi:hypothetical protein
MLEYVFVATFFLVLAIAAWIRIRFPFWSLQPVFHSYDVWRYLASKPFVIQHGSALPTKYFQPNRVKTAAFLDLMEEERAALLDTIQCHYIPSEDVTYTLRMEDLTVLCSHHATAPCWVSMYRDSNILLDSDAAAAVILGAVVAYPVRFVFRNSSPIEYVYYWDVVVMHREVGERHVDSIRTLLQTHEANQRRQSGKHISCSLFRKDVDLSEGIVPLVKFTVNRFPLAEIKKPPLPAPYTVHRIQHAHPLMDILYDLSKDSSFDVLIFPELTALQARIQSNQWFVFTLQSKDTVLALYVFRDTHMIVDDEAVLELSISLSMSLQTQQTSQSVLPSTHFFAGFLHALHDVLLITRSGLLDIPNMGHNMFILDTWNWKYTPQSRHDAAFYLYNMVCPGMPLRPDHCWITI